jgi:hypothetical protein
VSENQKEREGEVKREDRIARISEGKERRQDWHESEVDVVLKASPSFPPFSRSANSL